MNYSTLCNANTIFCFTNQMQNVDHYRALKRGFSIDNTLIADLPNSYNRPFFAIVKHKGRSVCVCSNVIVNDNFTQSDNVFLF